MCFRTLLLIIVYFTVFVFGGEKKENSHRQFTGIRDAFELKSFLHKYTKETNARTSPIRIDTILAQLGPITGAGNSLTNTTARLLLDTKLQAEPYRYEVSSLCLNHTKIFLEALLDGNGPWALQMIDALGKPASNILGFNTYWPGAYEECLAVKANKPEGVNKTSSPFDGLYCNAMFSIENAQTSIFGQAIPLLIGTCFPDSCSDYDATVLTNLIGKLELHNERMLAKRTSDDIPYVECDECHYPACSYQIALSLIPLNATSSFTYTYCVRDLEYSSKAIAVIVVCSIFLAIMTIATVYDMLIVRNMLSCLWSSPEYEGLVSGKYGSFNGAAVSDHTPLISSQNGGPDHNGQVKHDKVNVSKDDQIKCHEPGFGGKILLSFSVYSNTLKILSTNQPAGTLTAVNGIRFISMTWVILGHTYAFGLTYTGLLGKILLSFSVYSNTLKILNTSQPSGTLTAVNGIRFISMTWVILGHTFGTGLSLTDNISSYLPEVLSRFTFQAISNATVAVDTFFVLSGLLVSYLSLKEMKKRGGAAKFKWGMYYFHRFWRLTPPYMLFLMFYVPLFKYWSKGPFWPQVGVEVDECKDTWWQNLLYINNFFRQDKMCMGWSWYLANDMQFYIISPILLIPLYYSSVLGTVVCLAFILVNFLSTGIISAKNDLSTSLLFGGNTQTSFEDIYVKPWCRIGPYVVGFFTGYILYKYDCKIRISKWLNMLCWLLATVIAILVLYGLYTSDGQAKDLGKFGNALYNATSRTAWGMCVAWVIFACAIGYGGPVNTLLSWRAIIPLSRLTYCAYLVHPVIMYVAYFSKRHPLHLYDFMMVYYFLGHICLSYAVAFVVSLAFESPMMGLEKALLGRGKNS